MGFRCKQRGKSEEVRTSRQLDPATDGRAEAAQTLALRCTYEGASTTSGVVLQQSVNVVPL